MFHRARSKLGRMLRRDAGDPIHLDTRVVFDEVAFRAREQYRANYGAIAEALCQLLEFEDALDLGCANGFLMEPLLDRGKDVVGVEVSAAILPLLPPRLRERVRIKDATDDAKIGDFGLVACVEVAEHVDPASSGSLVDAITRNARRWVYFTAASPYQGGHGHINCRPQFFWMNEFRRRGFALDWDRTERLVQALGDLQPAEWLPKNSLIFSREGA